jgi:hypothetical protein
MWRVAIGGTPEARRAAKAGCSCFVHEVVQPEHFRVVAPTDSYSQIVQAFEAGTV